MLGRVVGCLGHLLVRTVTSPCSKSGPYSPAAADAPLAEKLKRCRASEMLTLLSSELLIENFKLLHKNLRTRVQHAFKPQFAGYGAVVIRATSTTASLPRAPPHPPFTLEVVGKVLHDIHLLDLLGNFLFRPYQSEGKYPSQEPGGLVSSDGQDILQGASKFRHGNLG